MLNMNTKSGGFATPSLQGGMGWVSLDWKQILKMIIAILTAIAGTLGVMSCMG